MRFNCPWLGSREQTQEPSKLAVILMPNIAYDILVFLCSCDCAGPIARVPWALFYCCDGCFVSACRPQSRDSRPLASHKNLQARSPCVRRACNLFMDELFLTCSVILKKQCETEYITYMPYTSLYMNTCFCICTCT